MVRRNRVLAAIRDNRASVGLELWTGNAAIVEMMGQFGFDWVGIDVEHTPYADYETVEELCRAADLAGLTPFVSIGSPDLARMTAYAERGVFGFIVGHTITPEDAALSVSAVKFPPAGKRGAATTTRQAGYSLTKSNWRDLTLSINSEVSVIGKIEDYEALQHLDSILETDIDGLMVGSFDLSHSISAHLNVPEALGNVAHPAVVEARELVYSKCREHGKFSAAVLAQLQSDGLSPVGVVETYAPQGVLVYALTHEFTILGEWYRRMAAELQPVLVR